MTDYIHLVESFAAIKKAEEIIGDDIEYNEGLVRRVAWAIVSRDDRIYDLKLLVNSSRTEIATLHEAVARKNAELMRGNSDD